MRNDDLKLPMQSLKNPTPIPASQMKKGQKEILNFWWLSSLPTFSGAVTESSENMEKKMHGQPPMHLPSYDMCFCIWDFLTG